MTSGGVLIVVLDDTGRPLARGFYDGTWSVHGAAFTNDTTVTFETATTGGCAAGFVMVSMAFDPMGVGRLDKLKDIRKGDTVIFSPGTISLVPHIDDADWPAGWAPLQPRGR